MRHRCQKPEGVAACQTGPREKAGQHRASPCVKDRAILMLADHTGHINWQ